MFVGESSFTLHKEIEMNKEDAGKVLYSELLPSKDVIFCVIEKAGQKPQVFLLKKPVKPWQNQKKPLER